MPPARERELIDRYLLRELSKDEQEAFERDYFDTEDAFDELHAAEHDLIDAYLGDRLSTGQRAQFERCFLEEPARRVRVEFARALFRRTAEARAAPRVRQPRMAPWAWLAAAAVVVMTAGGGWSYLRIRTLHAELEQARSEQQRQQGAQAALQARLAEQQAGLDRLRDELARAQAEIEARLGSGEKSRSLVRVAVLLLRSGLQRDFEPRTTLLVAPDTRQIRLQLLLGDDEHARYDVTVETTEGRPVASRTGLTAVLGRPGKRIEVTLDAHQVPAGDYVATATGRSAGVSPEPVADFSFRILRKD